MSTLKDLDTYAFIHKGRRYVFEVAGRFGMFDRGDGFAYDLLVWDSGHWTEDARINVNLTSHDFRGEPVDLAPGEFFVKGETAERIGWLLEALPFRDTGERAGYGPHDAVAHVWKIDWPRLDAMVAERIAG